MSFNVPVAGVSTEVPLLPEGDVLLQIVESTVEPNKDKVGLNWKLKAVTTTPLKSVDGRDIAPNFPLYHTMALQAKDGSTDPEAFRRSLSEAVDAIFGTTKDNRPDINRPLVDSAVGRSVIAHVYIDEWQGKQNNKVKRLKKAA